MGPKRTSTMRGVLSLSLLVALVGALGEEAVARRPEEVVRPAGGSEDAPGAVATVAHRKPMNTTTPPKKNTNTTVAPPFTFPPANVIPKVVSCRRRFRASLRALALALAAGFVCCRRGARDQPLLPCGLLLLYPRPTHR